MKKDITMTTRMEEMREKYPNLKVENGMVTFEDEGKILFQLPIQGVEYLKDGYLVLRRSENEKEIFSLGRKEKIKSVHKNVTVNIITQDRKLKGLQVTDPSTDEVIDLDGRIVMQASRCDVLLQATELLGSREVYIKKVDLSTGRESFITFQGEELEIPWNAKMEYEDVQGETYICITQEKQKWYNPHFRKVVELKRGYKIKEFKGINEKQFQDELPFDKREMQRVIWYDKPDDEYRTTVKYYPAGLESPIVVEEYESLYFDAKQGILYHIRPTHGRVIMYRCNSGNHVTFAEYLGYTHVNLLPILEVN